MNEFIIKKSDIKDLDTLQNLAIKTFYETFSGCNTQENIQIYLDKSFNENKLTNEILNFDSEFYIIWHKNNAIGYLKVNFNDAQTELKDKDGMEIERIYVLKDYHGKKIGFLLLNHAIEISKNQNKKYVWLGVQDTNYRAVKFYQKNGFNEFDKHIFKLGNEEQTDLLMKLEMLF